jgi:hypothetical protein
MTVILADFLRAEFYGYVYRLEASQLLDDAAKETVRNGLNAAKAFSDTLHLPIAAGRIPVFQDNALSDKDCTGKTVQTEFYALMDAIERELAERKLVFVHPTFAHYLENEKPFGDAVFENFKSARNDIKDASNCMAVGLYTAAVFHLMRSVEIGLRAMAHDLNVRIKNKQLEYLQWQVILDQIDKKISERISKLKPGTEKKAAALEFYNGAMGQFEGFKDEFRNNVMHSRSHYDEYRAWSVFMSVKAFMQKLAMRLKEGD